MAVLTGINISRCCTMIPDGMGSETLVAVFDDRTISSISYSVNRLKSRREVRLNVMPSSDALESRFPFRLILIFSTFVIIKCVEWIGQFSYVIWYGKFDIWFLAQKRFRKGMCFARMAVMFFDLVQAVISLCETDDSCATLNIYETGWFKEAMTHVWNSL